MNLTRFRGDNKDIVITITDDTGTALDLTGCTSFVLTADPSKAPIDSVNNLFALAGSIISAVAGSVGFAISTVQADHVGLFYYDVAYIDADGKVCTAGVDTLKFVQDIGKDFLTDNVPAETPLTSLAYIDQAVIDAQAAAAAADLDAQATAADRIQTGLDVLAAEASATPDIGEIRYFSTAPTGLGWMACDGAPYLRTAYPDYEGMRPEPAFSFTLIANKPTAYIGGACWTGVNYVCTGGGWNSRAVYVSADAITWTTYSTALPAGWQSNNTLLVVNGGTVLAIEIFQGFTVVSTDHGVTWSASVTLSTGTVFVPEASKAWTRPLINGIGQFVSFRSGANIIAVSGNGTSWTYYTIPIAGSWQCLYDISPGEYSNIIAADARSTGLKSEIDNTGYVSVGDGSPVIGNYNDFRGNLGSANGTFSVVLSQKAKHFLWDKSGWYVTEQISYDLPIDVEMLNGVASIGGRFVCGAAANALVIYPEAKRAEHIANPYTSSLGYVAGVAQDAGGALLFATPGTIRLALDPLKFNAPGLPDKAGATPYVFTGA